jgi:hypothetical protein
MAIGEVENGKQINRNTMVNSKNTVMVTKSWPESSAYWKITSN